MPSISNSISASKTIREFLASYKEGYDIYITGPIEAIQIYNVDIVWDGGNYYITYTQEDNSDATIYIESLDKVLPMHLEKQTTST